MEINQAHIIITGAASGIGFSILEELLNFDCKIVAADKNAELLEEVTSSHRDKVTPFAGDLANPDKVDQLFDFALHSLGSVELFIANAGFAYYEQFMEADWSHLELIFRINTFSPIYSLMKMGQLISGKRWKTVMVCSAMAEWALPGYSVYSATKSALHRFAEGYRFESSENHLMVVYPIATRTAFFETAGRHIPLPFPVQSPETVAKKIIKGILDDRQKLFPSALFSTVFAVNRIFPFIKRLYQYIEFRKLKIWLHTDPSC